MSVRLNSLSGGISSVACGCFIIGCLGYSSVGTIFRNLSWITIDESNTQVWFALKKSYYNTLLGKATISYNDGSCTQDFCDSCKEGGESCFILLIIATVFAFATSSACGSLVKYPNVMLQLGTLVMTGVSLGAAIIGMGMFMGDCFDEINDATNMDLHWGSGSIISMIGLLLMGIVAIAQLLGTLMCRGA